MFLICDIELSISGGGNEVFINTPEITHTRVIQLLKNNLSSEINEMTFSEFNLN